MQDGKSFYKGYLTYQHKSTRFVIVLKPQLTIENMKHYFLLIMLLIAISVQAQNGNNDAASKENFSDDWAALSHYEKENQTLSPPARGENRIVLLGSSIFEKWKDADPQFFKDHPYLDRGISGQKAELTIDGVHLNMTGYKIMEKVTEKAIHNALQENDAH